MPYYEDDDDEIDFMHDDYYHEEDFYEFDQEDFNNFVLENNVVGFFEKPITLKSGRESHFYVNWRDVTNDVFLLDKLADYILGFATDNGLNTDFFYGVPEGATKTGVITQYKYLMKFKNNQSNLEDFDNIYCLPMGRAKPKEHGAAKDKYFVGEPNGVGVVIEDVTTTGGSLLTTIDRLVEAGVEVQAAISLTNRMEKRDDGKSVEEAVLEKGVMYFYSMSNALDLLPKAYRKLKPSDEVARAIEKEFEKYGVERLVLRR